MAVLSIVKIYRENYDCVGSCLRIPSNDVVSDEFGSEWLKKFIMNMFETLYSNSSGVGLAANQVGMLKRICVVDIKRDGKKPLVLINPKYEPLSDEIVDSHEVCLSFPMVSSLVTRHKKISVKYHDFYGKECCIVAEGFKATVFQHEIDHLDGIVHVDLVQNQDDLVDYEGYNIKIAKNAINNVLKEEKGQGNERE